MAEEPRRSVRATKGQHTKSLDLLDAPPDPPKKKSSKKAKKVIEEPVEEAEEIIRCVCGATESSDNDPEPWIACDGCQVWQHNVCMGVSTFEDEIPDKYKCERCAPQLHTSLLASMERGEKIWIQRRREYEQKQLELEQETKKKSKKKKRTSTPLPKVDASHAINGSKSKASPAPLPTPPAPATAPAPVEAKKKEKEKEGVVRSGSTKRKVRDESHDQETAKEPQQKVRKVSAAHISPRQESPPSSLPVKIAELESLRQGPTRLIQKGLQSSLPLAIKNGIYTLNKDDTLESKVERLACQIEDAVFTTHPDKSSYTAQCRTLGFNLKQNQELCIKLLNKTLSLGELAIMSSDDMASKELKRETAEMKARAEKQSIMISDDGPRIRRTHKGEEVVESENAIVPSDSTMSISRRRSMIDPNADMAGRSRENSYGDGVELPENIDTHRSQDNIRANVAPKQPLNIDTDATPPVRKASQDNFDINKVFSSVQSPTSASHIRRPSNFSSNAPPVNGPGVDPEIDKMLQDDGNSSPPYSPAEYPSDPEVVWRGSVTMDSISKFPAIAKHVAGADLSRILGWSDILQKDLRVAGRIDQEKANEYLCSLRYNAPTDVVVVNVTPAGESASQSFQVLFDYFQSRKKYGVLANKGVGNIRDTYLVPVPATPGHLPDFIINLEGHRVPDDRPEPMILIALVIRGEASAEHRPYEGQPDMQSPSVMGHPQRQMSISGAGPAMSPIPPQGNNPFTTPPIPQGQFYAASNQQQVEEDRFQKQRAGEQLAVRILGEYINAPTIGFLMPQAYQMRENEWDVIRKILEQDERARDDLQHLSQVLETRMAGQD